MKDSVRNAVRLALPRRWAQGTLAAILLVCTAFSATAKGAKKGKVEENSTLQNGMAQYEADHIAKIRALSPECMVLLKSDGTFPLSEAGKIAAYGSGVRRTKKGGTGSGDVNPRHTVTVEEGLANAGFELTTKDWLDKYDAVVEEEYQKFAEGVRAKVAAGGVDFSYIMGVTMPEPEYDIPLAEDVDTALYVLARTCGEGVDRQAVKGDFLLTDTEVRDILYLAEHAKKFMLVLNVGAPLDITPVLDKVPNVLLLSQLGMTTGDALGDVLLGKAYPSGKLAATWAKYDDYCHEGDFGDLDDTRYKEGIYVGYKYFDSVDKEPMFPFGFGLSYTTFEVGKTKVSAKAGKVTVSTTVKNTGKRAGKEVMQLYVSKPSVKLDQPYQTLCAFAKTKELAPGKSGKVTLSFNMADIASFDNEAAESVLEAGDYVLHLGNSSRNNSVCAVVKLGDRVVLSKHEHVGGTPDFTDWKPSSARKVEVPASATVLTVKAGDIKAVVPTAPVISDRAMSIAKSLSNEELARLCVGSYADDGSTSNVPTVKINVSGASGAIRGIVNQGVPYLILADGPAGVRIDRVYGEDADGVYTVERGAMAKKVHDMTPQDPNKDAAATDTVTRNGEIKEHNSSAFPIGTALAQSFDPSLAEICGGIAGDELTRFGVNVWLAPGMNIQRDALCARNFEYYSEDPLITGKMAAAITRGVQQYKTCGVTLKHFCANNQENGRLTSNSQMSERTLREIYLKGFEIAVKEANPSGIMSSFNLLNGEHVSQRRDIMETLLRGEWGYKNFVMTDWVVWGSPDKKYPGAVANGTLCAGNDILMPGSQGDCDNILKSMTDSEAKYQVTREMLETSGARLIDAALRLGQK